MNSIKIKKYVEKNYQIGIINQIKYFNSKTNNQNYLIKSSSGKFILHIIEEDLSNRQIEKICKILEFCHRKKSRVPFPLKTIDNHYTHDKIFLTNYFSGHFFSGHLKELENFAKHLAHLHKTLKTCKIQYTYSSNDYFYKILTNDEILKIKDLIVNKSNKDKIDYYILKNLNQLVIELNFLTNNSQYFKKYEKYRQLVHYDLHSRNVLFQNHDVAAILDFNSLRIGYLLEDLAFAAFRFALNVNSKKYETTIDFFLQNYFAINNIIISNASIRFYLIQRILRGLCYVIKKRYFCNENIWVSDLRKYFKFLSIAVSLQF